MFKELEAKIQQDLIALGEEVWADLTVDVPMPNEAYISRVDEYLSRLHTRVAPALEVTLGEDGSFIFHVPPRRQPCQLTIVATRVPSSQPTTAQ